MTRKRKKYPRIFDEFPLRKIVHRISAHCSMIVLECGHITIDMGQKTRARCTNCPKKEKK